MVHLVARKTLAYAQRGGRSLTSPWKPVSKCRWKNVFRTTPGCATSPARFDRSLVSAQLNLPSVEENTEFSRRQFCQRDLARSVKASCEEQISHTRSRNYFSQCNFVLHAQGFFLSAYAKFPLFEGKTLTRSQPQPDTCPRQLAVVRLRVSGEGCMENYGQITLRNARPMIDIEHRDIHRANRQTSQLEHSGKEAIVSI